VVRRLLWKRGMRLRARDGSYGSAACEARPRRPRLSRRLAPLRWGLLTATLASACLAPELPDDGRADGPGATVAAAVGTTTCSTDVVRGLSLQIAQEVGCMFPDSLTRFEEADGIQFSGPQVLPFLWPDAIAALTAAASTRSEPLVINSAYRTVAQQYLVFQWKGRRCGIKAAAAPGRSNHETGRALDVDNWSVWLDAMKAAGWSHPVPGDAVHFENLSAPDIRGADVRAFQRLWNRNHPEDLIEEDGDFGPATQARLVMAPAGGFPDEGEGCPEAAALGGALVSLRRPDHVPPGTNATITIDVRNTGTTPWEPGKVFLATATPWEHDSPLQDPATWPTPGRAATVASVTIPGATGRFTFVIHAPQVADGTMVHETFGLVAEGLEPFAFGARLHIYVSADPPPDDDEGEGTLPDAGPIDDTPDAGPPDEPTPDAAPLDDPTPDAGPGEGGGSGGGSDEEEEEPPLPEDTDPITDEDRSVNAGCAAGGGAGPLLLVGLALARRRRRAR
jgi:hypothetical protein